MTVVQTSEGETCGYTFGLAKKFIPFYGPFTGTKTLVIHFDQSGRVTSREAEVPDEQDLQAEAVIA
jgi:hypothetical protein